MPAVSNADRGIAATIRTAILDLSEWALRLSFIRFKNQLLKCDPQWKYMTHSGNSVSSADTLVCAPREGLVTVTHIIYGLHAFSALSGILSSAFIVTAFLSGWPSIIAVIVNYAKRSEVHGTWLDSHFRWQIRTFWFSLAWLLAGAGAFATLVGIPLAFVIWIGTGLWVVYRLVRGWLALAERRAMPVLH